MTLGIHINDMKPLFWHVPHASTRLPRAFRGDFRVPQAVLQQEQLRLTDWYADELYLPGARRGEMVRADFSRLVVDVERFAEDARERCSAVGMGATYLRTTQGEELRRLTKVRRAELLRTFYRPHHARLDTAARVRLERFGRCLLIDAHTFPAEPLPTQVDFRAPPEIGLGTEGVHTSPELRRLAEDYFRQRGFTVGVDRPFSGSLVPNLFFGRDSRVQSLMVEVRRDLYMDEATGAKHAGFRRVQAVLAGFGRVCQQFSRSGTCAAWAKWPTMPAY